MMRFIVSAVLSVIAFSGSVAQDAASPTNAATDRLNQLPLAQILTASLSPSQSPSVSVTTQFSSAADEGALGKTILNARALKPRAVCTAIAAEFVDPSAVCTKGSFRNATTIIEVQKSTRSKVAFDVTIASKSALLTRSFSDNTFERLDLAVQFLIDIDGTPQIIVDLEDSVQARTDLNSIFRADREPFQQGQRRMLKTAVGRVVGSLTDAIGPS